MPAPIRPAPTTPIRVSSTAPAPPPPCRVALASLLAPDDHRHSFATTQTERGATHMSVLALERVQKRHEQSRAGAADRVAQTDGPAAHVDLVLVERELADGR